jgi:hypothetical protein
MDGAVLVVGVGHEQGCEGWCKGAVDGNIFISLSSRNGWGDSFGVEECMSFEPEETSKVNEWLGSFWGESVPESSKVGHVKFEGEEVGNGKAIDRGSSCHLILRWHGYVISISIWMVTFEKD